MPQVSIVVNQLRARGIDLGSDIYTVEAAGKAILDYIQAKNVLGEGR